MQKNEFLLQHLLVNTVKKYGNKTALICDKDSKTYRQLYEDCLQFSCYLKKQGAERGDRIVIQSGNSYLTVISFFAAIFCDAIPCILDENTDQNTLMSLVSSLSPKFLVTKKNADHIIFDGIICINDLPERKDEEFLLKFSNTEQDLVMIMHTSGSTGIPKGVMLSHRNVISAINSILSYLMLDKKDVIFSVLPMHFDYGLYQLLLSISVGATLILEEGALLLHQIKHKIIRYQATVLPCVPYIIQLLDALFKKDSLALCVVRIVTNTGEHITEKHIKKIQRIFPMASIYSMYGLTECKRCSYVPPGLLPHKMDSIGIPMPNLEMWVQDRSGNKLPAGMEGDLVVSGPTVMRGYWKNETETKRKIFLDKDGKRVLLTGDKAVMDADGFFYFKGRKDFLVKFKGLKLSFQDYVKKINMLEFINRSHLFMHESKLIVCIETDSIMYNKNAVQLKISSLFPTLQKPNYFYFTDNFPALSNGKLHKKNLEKLSTHSLGIAL